MVVQIEKKIYNRRLANNLMNHRIAFSGLAIMISFLLVSQFAFAAGAQNGSGSGESGQPELYGSGMMQDQSGQGEGEGAGMQTSQEQQTSNQGESSNLMERSRVSTQVQASSAQELGQMIMTRQREMDQEAAGTGGSNAAILQNQNKVRLAVHAMLSMEDLTGNIGPQVSEIATQFNNSVQATIQAEERMQSRNAIVKFFAGGDGEAAQEMLQQTVANKQRLSQLSLLMQDCNCSEEVRSMLQEQIQSVEQEQARLETLAQGEIRNRGIFGWLGGLFGG
jgi:hypothetical protein